MFMKHYLVQINANIYVNTYVNIIFATQVHVYSKGCPFIGAKCGRNAHVKHSSCEKKVSARLCAHLHIYVCCNERLYFRERERERVCIAFQPIQSDDVITA